MKIKTLVILLFIAQASFCQQVHTLTHSLLNGPEGIIYDEDRDLYFIANATDGKILTLNAEHEFQIFAEGFGIAMGFNIIGDSLFIASNSPRKFSCLNKFSGDTLYQIDLNDSTISISQMVYDSRNGFMYLNGQEGSIVKIDIKRATYSMFVKAGEGLINGSQTIELDTVENRLLVFSYPSPLMKSVSLSDSTEIESINCGLSKSIASMRDEEGDIFVSSWTGSRIWKFTPPDYTHKTLVCNDSLDGPAGIAYNTLNEEYAVCNYYGNFITFIDKDYHIGFNESNKPHGVNAIYSIYNRAISTVEVHIKETFPEEDFEYIVFNLQGRKIQTGLLSKSSGLHQYNVPFKNRNAGIYFIRVFHQSNCVGTDKFIVY